MEQEELRQQLEEARAEVKKLQRQNARLERDNQFLSVTNENAERLRQFNRMEMDRQYLYNDLLLKNCPNMILLFDENLRLVIHTTACYPMLCMDEVGRPSGVYIQDVFSAKIMPEWIEQVVSQCETTVTTLQSFHYNDRISFVSGEYVYAQISIDPIYAEYACKGVVLVINDTTELALMKDKAEDSAQAKGSFLANMSHEIRTPMNAVKGLSELLMLTNLDSVQKGYVSNILKSSHSLLQIINDILDFSKIDANRIEITTTVYSTAAVIDDVIKVNNLRAEEKRLMIVTDISPDIPSHLRGDDIRIKQVLTNILSNAVKYTQTGHIRLNIHSDEIPGTGGSRIRLVFRVQDTGIGIRDEDQPNLFNSFSRVDLLANRGIIGTGLGLAITKQLLNAMNGDITLESVYGEGSNFTFWVTQEVEDSKPIVAVDYDADRVVLLVGDPSRVENKAIAKMLDSMIVPYVLCANREDADNLRERAFSHIIYNSDNATELVAHCRNIFSGIRFTAVKSMRRALNNPEDTVIYHPVTVMDLADVLSTHPNSEKSTDIQGSREGFKYLTHDVRVLLVDDNEINLILGKEMLGVYDIDVETAENGALAVVACHDEAFDLIFMDHMMPIMDGVEATAKIRDNETSLNRETPIIALTANALTGMKEFFFENRMDDYISKPIDVSELDRVLVAWLPPDKIVARAGAVPVIKQAEKHAMDIVGMMDDFGMCASDVVDELGSMIKYAEILQNAAKELPPLVDRLKRMVNSNEWSSFKSDIGHLRELLHNVGAREYAEQAKDMELAIDRDDVDYILGDFFGLMENIYMLEAKLWVLSVACGGGETGRAIPVNNPEHLKSMLAEMKTSLDDSDICCARFTLDKMASLSLDKELDMYLKMIKNALDSEDMVIASLLVEEAINNS